MIPPGSTTPAAFFRGKPTSRVKLIDLALSRLLVTNVLPNTNRPLPLKNSTFKITRMKKILRKALLLAVFALTVHTIGFAQSYNWKAVRIGGGGRVPSIKAHPKVPNLFFITTDVASPFRWNNSLQRWEPMMQGKHIPLNYWNWEKNQLCGDLAFDPNDSTGNILYATVANGQGPSPGTGNPDKGTVMKSTDRGDTWTDCGLQILVAPNSDQGVTDRLVVDPQNSNTVYVTTDGTGTYKSNAAGAPGSWVKLVTPFDTLQGRFIKFDLSSGTLGGVTKTIYIGTVNGVYVSTDTGATFSLMPGSPTSVKRASIANDGTMYVTTTAANGSIVKWNGSSWLAINPDATRSFSAIAVNPANSNEVLTASTGTWNNDKLYRTTTGGVSGGWTAMNVTRDNTEAPHSLGGNVTLGNAGHNIDMFCFDPFNPGQAWFSDETDVARTTDVWAGTVNWVLHDVGLEEVAPAGQLVCPPYGRNVLLSTTGDVGGFDHPSFTEPPPKGMASFFSTATGVNTSGVDIQYTNPDFIARTGSDGWAGSVAGGYSDNGGLSYTVFPTYPTGAVRGRVAVSATSPVIVWVSQGGGTFVSFNKGTSWAACAGVPGNVLPAGNIYSINAGQAPVAADKVSGNIFYLYAKDIAYVSEDTGRTFVPRASNLPTDGGYASYSCLVTTPGKSGDVWFSNSLGLFHSTDTARTFTRINAAAVPGPKWIAIGKADTLPSSPPVIYVTNETKPINGIYYGVFRSDDNGATWNTISDNVPAVVRNMAADNHGRVFMGLNGNGFFVGEPVGGPVTGVSVTPSSDSVIVSDSVKLKVALTPVYPANSNVSWSSSDTAIASVNASGLVIAKAAGNVTITVTTADGNLTAASAITVTPIIHVTGVTLDTAVYVGVGGAANMTANIVPSNAKNKTLTWTSSDTTIVKVNASGLITAIAPGTATITVTTQDSGRTATSVVHVGYTAKAYNVGDTAHAYGNFAVDPNNWAWTWITSTTTAITTTGVANPAPQGVYQTQRNGLVSNTSYSVGGLLPNASYTMRLHFAELGATVVAGAKKFNVVINSDTVLKLFDIYAAAGGRYKAVVEEFPFTSSSTGTVSVKFVVNTGYPSINAIEVVLTPVTGVTINKDSAFVGVGDTTRLTATVLPANASNKVVSWKSSDPSVAVVSSTGLVTGIGPGTAVITVTTAEGSKTAVALIRAANIPVTSVVIDSATATVGVNNTKKLTATVSPANATNKAVNWSSSDTTVIKVDANGLLTGKAPGTATITVTTQDGSKTASIIATSANILLNNVTLSKTALTLGKGDTATIKAGVSPANASNTAIGWTSTDTTIATVNSAGFITALKAGSATITATAMDSGHVAGSLPLTVIDPGSCGLLQNNGFESGFVNWIRSSADAAYITDSVPLVHSGLKAVVISGQSTPSINYNAPIPVSGGTEITFTAWGKIAGSPNPANASQLLLPYWAGIGIDYLDSAGNKISGESNQFQVYSSAAPAILPSSYTKFNVITRVAPAGTASVGIWASKAGPGYFFLDDLCITLNVTSVSLDADSVTLLTGAARQVNSTVLPANATDKSLIWISTDTTVATVTATGLVTAIAPGNAGVIAIAAADTTKRDSVAIRVTNTVKAYNVGDTVNAYGDFKKDPINYSWTWTTSTTTAIDRSAVTNPAPEAVYQSQRNGLERNNPYWFTGLTPNSNYKVRLHFAELTTAVVNSKRFNVIINGDTVLHLFDIYAAAGGRYKAIVKEFPVTASATGSVYVKFDTYTGNSSCNGIEIIVNSSGSAGSSMAQSPALDLVPSFKKSDLGKAELTVYPNPVSGNINFRLSGYNYQDEPLLIELVSINGRRVLATRMNSDRGTSIYKIDTGQKLMPGIYLLRVSGKGLDVVTKIMVL